MKSRSGLYQPEQASRPEIVVASDRQLLVSEGEHSHAALVAAGRSEEHTSELQSLMRISYAVFCLKKKHTNTTHLHVTHITQKDQNNIKSKNSHHTMIYT